MYCSLRKATTNMGVKPLTKTTAIAAPPGFESLEATCINDVVDFQRDTLV